MEASVTLGLNAAPFTAGLQKAQTSAKNFAGTMSASRMWDFMGNGVGPAAEKAGMTFSQRFVSMFRRTTEHRAESQIGLFAANLASGNVGGAIMGLSRSISGFGLAAGVAIGIGIESFIKFKEQIDATREATKAVNQELSKPLSLQGALGPEGIGKEIEKAQASLENLSEKRKTWGSITAEFVQRHKLDLRMDTGRPVVIGAEKAQRGETKRTYDLMVKQAEAEERVTAAQKLSLETGEEAAAIEKVRLDVSEKRAAILLAARPKAGTIDPLGAVIALRRAANVSEEGDVKIGMIRQRADLKERELALEERILLVGSSSLSTDEKRLGALRERISFLKREMSGENDPLKKHALGNQLLGAEKEQRNLQMEYYFNPGLRQSAQAEARANASREKEFNRTGGLLSPHWGMGGNLLSGIDPVTGQRVTPGQKKAADSGGANDGRPLNKADMKDLFEEYIGKN